MSTDKQSATIDETYQETLDLLDEVKEYFTRSNEMVARSGDGALDLRKACEASRVTAQLSQVVAWLLAQKAVGAGELTRDEAYEQFGLSYDDTCLNLAAVENEELPQGLRRLLERGADLFERVAELERKQLS